MMRFANDEVRPPLRSALRRFASSEVHPEEPRLHEGRLTEVRFAERRIQEVRPGEVRFVEVGGLAEVRLGEVSLSEVARIGKGFASSTHSKLRSLAGEFSGAPDWPFRRPH